jgi:hypothetical protein
VRGGGDVERETDGKMQVCLFACHQFCWKRISEVKIETDGMSWNEKTGKIERRSDFLLSLLAKGPERGLQKRRRAFQDGGGNRGLTRNESESRGGRGRERR